MIFFNVVPLFKLKLEEEKLKKIFAFVLFLEPLHPRHGDVDQHFPILLGPQLYHSSFVFTPTGTYFPFTVRFYMSATLREGK